LGVGRFICNWLYFYFNIRAIFASQPLTDGRTLKENLLWVRTFETIEDLRRALLAFREIYNTTWLIERHGFISPAEYRQKQLQPITAAA
jgi:hypothetical protein